MESKKEILMKILWGLSDAWKDSFGLYTHYIGYLTPGMMITLLMIKREADMTWEYDCGEFDLEKINNYAQKNDLDELPCEKEVKVVVPKLWRVLEKYDLSEQEIPKDVWEEFITYLKRKRSKEK